MYFKQILAIFMLRTGTKDKSNQLFRNSDLQIFNKHKGYFYYPLETV